MDIEAIRARADAATEGPWVVELGNWTGREPWHQYRPAVPIPGRPFGGEPLTIEEDAEFCVHARTDIPALCDEVERLRAEVSQMVDDHPKGYEAGYADGRKAVEARAETAERHAREERALRDDALSNLTAEYNRAGAAEAKLAKFRALTDKWDDAVPEAPCYNLWSAMRDILDCGGN